MANFRQGQNNSILVITAGPHTDQSLDGTGPATVHPRGASIRRSPVAVNVIDFGVDSDRATWEAGRAGQRRQLPEPGQSRRGRDLTTRRHHASWVSARRRQQAAALRAW